MKPWQRVAWCGLLLAAQSLYLPLNRWMTGGVALSTPLDALVPLWPIWVVPYALCWPWWLLAYLWAAHQMEARLFRALALGTLFTILAAMAFYFLFPTYVIRPTLTGSDWASAWLRDIYAADGRYNAFPSGHVYLTTLISLFWARWFPRLRWWWASLVVIVSLATLFTGQHYVLDPIGGALLAWIGYRLGLGLVYGREAGARRPAGLALVLIGVWTYDRKKPGEGEGAREE